MPEEYDAQAMRNNSCFLPLGVELSERATPPNLHDGMYNQKEFQPLVTTFCG
jgi:hypothetical protein